MARTGRETRPTNPGHDSGYRVDRDDKPAGEPASEPAGGNGPPVSGVRGRVPTTNRTKERHHALSNRKGLPRRQRDSGRRLLRRADAAREGELPHHRHSDGDGAVLRQGVRLRQESRRTREPRPRRARSEGGRRDRRRLRSADRRRDARSVRHRLHPGRGRDVDQHERERGHRQPRAGASRPYKAASISTSIRTITSTSGSRPTTSTRPPSGSR